MQGIIILTAFTLLYTLSRRLTQNLFITFMLVTRSRPAAVALLSLIFFPGTVIHELSHLFTAEILGVRTGGLTLVPEGIEEKNVKTGSVMISQTDPVRRAVIGIAPVFSGLGTITGISFFLPQLWQDTWLAAQNGILFDTGAVWLFLLAGYSLFAVSNTMFSSPEDLEGFWPVTITLGLFALAGYVAGFRFGLTGPLSDIISRITASVAASLGYVTVMNVALLLGSILLIRLTERITKRKLVVKSQ